MTQEPQESNDRVTIRKYLLAQLADLDRQAFEQRLLTNDEVFEELVVCEEELIDLYVRDQLSPSDKEVMAKHFLVTPERQQKLRFAQVLNRYLTEAEEREKIQVSSAPPVFWSSQSWMFRAAVAIALIAISGGLFWMLRSPSTTSTATLVLMPSTATRAEGPQWGRVKLPIQGDSLKISLKLPESMEGVQRYRAELKSEDGDSATFTQADHDQQTVSFVIPAKQLVPARYTIRLYAITGEREERQVNANYFFLVE